MTTATAIVGAGIAGLSLARRLRDQGRAIVVFDKARGPGGRMASRRLEPGTIDHGAQSFTATDEGFRAEVERWNRAGVIAVWSPRLVTIDADGAPTPQRDERTRFVGTPRMSSITRALSRGLDLRAGHRVTAISGDPGERWLHDERGDSYGPYDEVLLALPSPQAIPLLEPLGMDLAALRAVEMAPCWAAMFTFDRHLDVPWDAADCRRGPLSWLARDSSKPGRARRERWIVHADPAWSRRHLELEPDQALVQLQAAAAEILGRLPEPDWAQAHRWRYARVESPAPLPSSYDRELGLGACGDWGVAAKVEGAWLSASHLARSIATTAAAAA